MTKTQLWKQIKDKSEVNIKIDNNWCKAPYKTKARQCQTRPEGITLFYARDRGTRAINHHKSGQKERERESGHMCKERQLSIREGERELGRKEGSIAAAVVVGTPRITYWGQERICVLLNIKKNVCLKHIRL